MNFILISDVVTEWNFCRSYVIQYEVILQEITGINFRRIYEDNRSFANGTYLKFKFKIFNLFHINEIVILGSWAHGTSVSNQIWYLELYANYKRDF